MDFARLDLAGNDSREHGDPFELARKNEMSGREWAIEALIDRDPRGIYHRAKKVAVRVECLQKQ